jgi:sugar phosphate isomerase/epimerase
MTKFSKCTRRELLSIVSLLPFSGHLLGAATPALRETAKKNIKMAIMSSVYAQLPLEEALKKMKEDGFSGAVTDYLFADVKFDFLAPDWGVSTKIVEAFRRHEIKIAGISAYYNIVDPDLERRKKGEAKAEFFLTHWKQLGCPIVCTGTGTLNRQSEWSESPENEKEPAYLQCRERLLRLAQVGEKHGSMLAIETYWRSIISTPERTARLFAEVKSPALQMVMDPCNYFRNEDCAKVPAMLEKIFKMVGNHSVVAHAKDMKQAPKGPDLPAAGLGEMDYPLYLRLLAGLKKPLYLALEHLTLSDVPRARDYVLSQFDQI